MAKFKEFKVPGLFTATKKKLSKGKSAGFKGALYGVSVDGIKDVLKNMDILEEAAKDAFAAAIHDEAVRVMEKSQKIVPVDQGDLKRSAMVKPPKTNKRPEASLTYNTPYALFQHEHHAGSEKNPGPRAGYLARPMRDSAKGMDRRIAKGTREHAAKGTRLGDLKTVRFK